MDLQYIAFLRAVNVGGHTVKMADLKRIFEAMGLADVGTFIASGNALFRTAIGNEAALEQQIGDRLQQALGYEVVTFLRTPAELRNILDNRPFGLDDTEGAPLHVGFLKEAPPRSAVHAVSGLRTDVDSLEVHGRELYWLAEAGLGRSRVSGKLLEKALGGPTTLRNMNTVRRLAAKFPA